MSLERNEIMDANNLFYQAFNQGDYSMMDDLWARQHDVCVIHPGWAPLHGRESVMKSWRRILRGVMDHTTIITNAKVYLMQGSAFVLCYEPLPNTVLIATNVFVKEGGIWKMVHHQAGVVYQVVVEPDESAVH